MAEVSIPAEMQYFPPSIAARARSYRQSITPMTQGPYKPTERIRIVLGTTPGTYLNTQHSYLEFDVVNNAAGSMRIDKHASSFIDRLEVYHAGALIDTVSGANVLYSALLDASVSPIDLCTTHACAGVDEIPYSFVPNRAAYDYNKFEGTTAALQEDWDFDGGGTFTSTIAESINPVYSVRGRKIYGSADSRGAGSNRVHVCLPLVGLLSPAGMAKYLPLGDAVNGNIEIDIYLSQAAHGGYHQPSTDGTLSVPDWQLENVQYEAQLCEIDASVHAALTQSIGGVYTIPYNSWRQYSATIAKDTTNYTFYIPTKVSSLSGVFVCMRDQNDMNRSATASISKRTRASLRAAQLRVGALNFPLKPLDCTLENGDQAMIESLKMFGRLGTSMGGVNMNRRQFMTNKFFLSFDTQAYSAASGAVDDGVQAQHGSTYLQLDFGGTGTPSNTQLDVYVLFDGMLTVANGAISAAF
jgi:hypothetical protein